MWEKSKLEIKTFDLGKRKFFHSRCEFLGKTFGTVPGTILKRK
jgi:hypothetical protein